MRPTITAVTPAVRGPSEKITPETMGSIAHTRVSTRLPPSSRTANATKYRAMPTVAHANVGSLNTTRSSAGAGRVVQRRVNHVRATVATANRPSSRASVRPQSLTYDSAVTSVPTPRASSAEPPRSGTRASVVGVSTSVTELASATTMTGRLMRKIQRQSAWASAPPRMGPPAAATEPTAVQMPSIEVWRDGGEDAISNASAVGTNRAAPRPCSPRAAMSTRTSPDTAANSAPRANTPRPSRKSRRRPYLSASRPAGTSSAAKTTPYALMTHDIVCGAASGKSALMDSKARLITNRSIAMRTAAQLTATTGSTAEPARSLARRESVTFAD